MQNSKRKLPNFELSIFKTISELGDSSAVDIARHLYHGADLRKKTSQVSVGLKRLEKRGLVRFVEKQGKRAIYTSSGLDISQMISKKTIPTSKTHKKTLQNKIYRTLRKAGEASASDISRTVFGDKDKTAEVSTYLKRLENKGAIEKEGKLGKKTIYRDKYTSKVKKKYPYLPKSEKEVLDALNTIGASTPKNLAEYLNPDTTNIRKQTSKTYVILKRLEHKQLVQTSKKDNKQYYRVEKSHIEELRHKTFISPFNFPHIPRINHLPMLMIGVLIVFLFYTSLSSIGFLVSDSVGEKVLMTLETKGNDFNYLVKNNHTLEMTDVQVSLSLDSGSNIIDSGTAEIQNNTLTWQIPYFSQGQEEKFSFSASGVSETQLKIKGISGDEVKRVFIPTLDFGERDYTYWSLGTTEEGWVKSIFISLSVDVPVQAIEHVPEQPIPVDEPIVIDINQTPEEPISEEITDTNQTPDTNETPSDPIVTDDTNQIPEVNETPIETTPEQIGTPEIIDESEILSIITEEHSVAVYLDSDSEINGNEILIGEVSVTESWQGVLSAIVSYRTFPTSSRILVYAPEKLNVNIISADLTLLQDVEIIEEKTISFSKDTPSSEDKKITSDGIEKEKTENIKGVSVNKKTKQYNAVLGRPVKWTKTIKMDKEKKVTVEIPKDASNITVKDTITGQEVKVTVEGKTLEQHEESVTGYVVAETDLTIGAEEITDQQSAELVVEEIVEEIEIEYETPAPQADESDLLGGVKQITIYSDYHYENILAFTEIPEAKAANIKLYHIENGQRNEVTIDLVDYDQNGKYDSIEWVVPHLSNQTYELNITILNPYEYLSDGDNWTVKFNTTGTADLYIESTNATWSEMLTDLNETNDEMVFLGMECGNTSLTDSLVLIDAQNNTKNYNQLTTEDNFKPVYFFIEDYSCDDTGYFRNNMLIGGYAVQKFTFGNLTAWAYDPPGEFGSCANCFNGEPPPPGASWCDGGDLDGMCFASSDCDGGCPGGNCTTEIGSCPANAAPVVSSSTSTPIISSVTDDLKGYCTSTDSDLDTISHYYRWYNGTSDLVYEGYDATYYASGAEGLVSTLLAGNTSDGENWIFSCLAFDATDNATTWLNSSNNKVGCGQTITESATLTGNITGCTNSYSFSISSDNVTLDCAGHTLEGSAESLNRFIYFSNQNNVTIKNCNISVSGENSFYAIEACAIGGTCYNISIINNTISAGETTVYLAIADNVTIHNNTIFTHQTTGNASAIASQGMDFSRITNNTINGAGRTIVFSSSDDHNIIQYNNITSSVQDAIFTGPSDNLTIRDNNITAPTKTLTVGNSDNVILLNNNITATTSYIIWDVDASKYTSLIYNTSDGQVTWNSTNLNISESGTIGLGTAVNLSSNLTEVASGTYAGLNQSANLTFRGLTVSRAVALRNNAYCGSKCSLVSSSGTTYWYNVSQFTNYSVGSLKFCQNSTDNFDFPASGSLDITDNTTCGNATGTINNGNLTIKNNAKLTIINATINVNPSGLVSGFSTSNIGDTYIENGSIEVTNSTFLTNKIWIGKDVPVSSTTEKSKFFLRNSTLRTVEISNNNTFSINDNSDLNFTTFGLSSAEWVVPQNPYQLGFSNSSNGTVMGNTDNYQDYYGVHFSNDYMTSDDSTGSMNKFSFTTWVKPSSLSGNRTIISEGDCDADYITEGFWFGFTGTNLTLLICDGSDIYNYTDDAVISTSQWIHVAFVYDGLYYDRVRMYVNGTYAYENTTVPTTMVLTGGEKIQFGTVANGEGYSYNYSGVIRDSRFYDDYITGSRVSADMNSEGTGSDMIHWWKMDNGGGTIVSDRKGTNDLTFASGSAEPSWYGEAIDQTLIKIEMEDTTPEQMNWFTNNSLTWSVKNINLSRPDFIGTQNTRSGYFQNVTFSDFDDAPLVFRLINATVATVNSTYPISSTDLVDGNSGIISMLHNQTIYDKIYANNISLFESPYNDFGYLEIIQGNISLGSIFTALTFDTPASSIVNVSTDTSEIFIMNNATIAGTFNISKSDPILTHGMINNINISQGIFDSNSGQSNLEIFGYADFGSSSIILPTDSMWITVENANLTTGPINISGTLISGYGYNSFGSLGIETTGTYISTNLTTTINGNFNNNGTFTHTNGTIDFDNDVSSYIQNTGTTEPSFYNLTHSSDSHVQISGNTTVEKALKINSAGTRFRLNNAFLTMGTSTNPGILEAVSSYPIQVMAGGGSIYGKDVSWPALYQNDILALYGNLGIKWLDIQGNYTTNAQNKTITMYSDCDFDNVTIAFNDTLDTNGYSATIAEDLVVEGVFHGRTDTHSIGSIRIGTNGLFNASSGITRVRLGTKFAPINYMILNYGTFTHNDGTIKIDSSKNARKIDLGSSILYDLDVDIDNIDYLTNADNTLEIENNLVVTEGEFRSWDSGEVMGYSIDVTGTTTIQSGGELDLDHPTGTDQDHWLRDVVIQASGTLVASNETTLIFGDFTNSGTFTNSSGEIDFAGSGKVLTGETDFNNITISSKLRVDSEINYSVMSIASTGNLTYNENNTDEGVVYYKYGNGEVYITGNSILNSSLSWFNGTTDNDQLSINTTGSSYYVDTVESGSAWIVQANQTPPTIESIEVDDGLTTPIAEIDLVGGTTKYVNCTAIINDVNTATDIDKAQGVFFWKAGGETTSCDENANNCYQNSSCTLTTIAGNNTAKFAQCGFNVWYNAQNTSNYGWTCNLTANDSANTWTGGAGTEDAARVNALVAIDINSSTMDFGALNPGQNSTGTVNVSNYGNTRIDIRLNGTGLSCDKGTVDPGMLMYNCTDAVDVGLTKGTNLTGTITTCSPFDLAETAETSTPSPTQSSVYWRLQVPYGGEDNTIGGECTGSVWFIGTQG
jgi:predicted transcriptional regulator